MNFETLNGNSPCKLPADAAGSRGSFLQNRIARESADYLDPGGIVAPEGDHSPAD